MTAIPALVVIRGNSGSGKTITAREVRRRYGRGCALIEQDYVRRELLREHGSDSVPTVTPAFLTMMAREALGHGYHVIVERILGTVQYGAVLRRLIAKHSGPAFAYWMEVSFEETVRRHHRRAEMIAVDDGQMRSWYASMDLLGVPGERIIDECGGQDEVVQQILYASGLAEAAPLTPCPVSCPRCRQKRRTARWNDARCRQKRRTARWNDARCGQKGRTARWNDARCGQKGRTAR